MQMFVWTYKIINQTQVKEICVWMHGQKLLRHAQGDAGHVVRSHG